MSTIQQDYDYMKDQLPKAIAAGAQASRGVRVKNDSPAAASETATRVLALSSNELGSEILFGTLDATP
jgi:hypothetical protein